MNLAPATRRQRRRIAVRTMTPAMVAAISAMATAEMATSIDPFPREAPVSGAPGVAAALVAAEVGGVPRAVASEGGEAAGVALEASPGGGAPVPQEVPAAGTARFSTYAFTAASMQLSPWA